MATITATPVGLASGALIVAEREIRDQLRDWRILAPIILLTLFFPLLMNFTAQQAVVFVNQYGAPLIAERLIPFLLMVVGFFPISISLVIALESFAGERERLSLEPLLATPLTDGQLYIGKMIASVVPPLAASYLGIGVYLLGLVRQVGWRPPASLLIQVLLLTTAQALVMVTGAVVISSQTTSVRAANLLASFIIVPMSQLIIGESLIMFWGRYTVLWWIVAALILLSAIMVRTGLHLFNREELLGRELDILDLRWVGRVFWRSFSGGAGSILEWYRGLFRSVLPRSARSILLTALGLIAAFAIGYRLASVYTLPPDLLALNRLSGGLAQELERFGLMTAEGWLWVVLTNLRAVALATLLGMFSFGVMAIILFMAPISIIGFFAGNMALAGQNAGLFLAALVLPHGLLEIPASILAGAAILRVGLAAVSLPRGTSLGESWLIALGEWARISLGLVLPLLLGAAAIEVFITPRVALWLLGGH